MCGIVGGIGKCDFRDYVLGGLKKLDYRGYDSAGLAYVKEGKVNLYKTPGTVEALASKVPAFEGAEMAVGHTRWATHGDPSEVNAHPQFSQGRLVYLVHNGVIENFRALKTRLKARGYSFLSQTDTEVIADVLEFHYLTNGKDALKAIRETEIDLEGSYACAIIFEGDEHLYFMKKGSPLLIGVGDKAMYLASDCLPMIKLAKSYVDLSDGDYGCLSPEGLTLYNEGRAVEPVYSERKIDDYDYDLRGYPHFMLKEIEEEPMVLSRLIDNYFDPESGEYLFDPSLLKAMKEADEIIFLACGTSHYASLYGLEFMEFYGKKANSYIASEWAYHPISLSKKPFYVLLSQSGETADLIACQKIINDEGRPNLAIVNVKDSTLSRRATYSCLIYAGLEVAVAATKSYIAQIGLMALLLGALTNSSSPVRHLEKLGEAIEDVIARKEDIHEIAKKITGARDAFFVGRGSDYSAALECALKLKEISYIHAEAYAGGEIKHGPIALIEKGTPVFGLISEVDTALPLRNNIEEVKSRGAATYIVSSLSLSSRKDAFVTKDVKPYLNSFLKVVYGQYLAYYVSLEKGLPIDKPRNLAKSVTVE